MVELKLIELPKDNSEVYCPLVGLTQKTLSCIKQYPSGEDNFSEEENLISLDVVAQLTDQPKGLVLKKLFQGGLPEDLFMFNKQEVENLIAEKGKIWFSKPKL